MSLSRIEKLTAQVEARNKLNKAIRQYVPLLIEIMKPFVGQKIVNADGRASKKFFSAFETVVNTTPSVQWVLDTARNSVKLYFKAWEVTSEQCMYEDRSVYVGDFGPDSTFRLPSNYAFNPEVTRPITMLPTSLRHGKKSNALMPCCPQQKANSRVLANNGGCRIIG